MGQRLAQWVCARHGLPASTQHRTAFRYSASSAPPPTKPTGLSAMIQVAASSRATGATHHVFRPSNSLHSPQPHSIGPAILFKELGWIGGPAFLRQ